MDSPLASVGTLSDVTGRFAELVDSANPIIRVPACPDWSVEDLVLHIGCIHEWAAASVRTGTGSEIPVAEGIPRAQLADWYRRRANALVDVLAHAGPSAPAWVFGPAAGAGLTAFWIRRQIQETVVHTWDLLAAHGVEEHLHPALAWDGVAEIRDVFYPRQVSLGRIDPLPAAMHLTAADLETPAVVLGSGERISVHLPASDMLLALWHRVTPEFADRRAGELMGRAPAP